MSKTQRSRRLPVGAEVQPGGGVHFRVWAPRCSHVEVVFEPSPGAGRPPGPVLLEPEPDGYFAGFEAEARAGHRYRYRLDGGDAYPDPVSRYQPDGPHGPSQVIDPGRFAWTDAEWRGPTLKGQVISEVHIGTFTPEGTWEAATRQLPALAETGFTTVELLPIADFPGRFGWGYDGVNLFGPTRLYGTPDDLRRFVDQAHLHGLAVVLDVVYNHFGPDGCYLDKFSADYVTDRYLCEWGKAINFDGEGSGPVREFFLANAAYWIDEFHLDGLRIDATQSFYDASPDPILAALVRQVRQSARGRGTLVFAENEPQQATLVRPRDRGGYGFDAVWNEDFHHTAMVAATGFREGYYSEHRGTPQELISALKWGFLFQGQRYRWQRKRRGTPALDLEPAAFINYLQNHDQVANSAWSWRFDRMTSPGRYRAITALFLLAPQTPMLFQGQEFGASTPFYYFGDQPEEVAEQMHSGRKSFLGQFRSLSGEDMQARILRPNDPAIFERSKLDPSERQRHAEALALHRDLLALRREDPVFRAQRPRGLDGAVLGPEAFVVRYFGEGGEDRLLLVNLGAELHLDQAPEPLLAPPSGRRWEALWSSEDPRYGGRGTPPLETQDNWWLPGHAAVALIPRA